MFHKVLAAIDTSESNKDVFEEAASLAKANNAPLMLLHVLSPFDRDYPAFILPSLDNAYPTLYEEAVKSYKSQWEEFQHENTEFLRSLVDRAVKAGVNAEFSQTSGEPGRVICDVARSWEADLIVLGRRGHTGLNELFLGSISNYVLHHASCSVLTVQGRTSPDPQTAQPKEEAIAS